MAQDHNLAYALRSFEPAEEREQQPKIRKLEKTQPRPKLHLGRSVLCIGYILLLCGALMFARVQLTEENNAMLQAQSDLEELQSESARLQLQVEGLTSLKTVEETALQEYGLVEPDQSQITAVRVDKENRVVPAETDDSVLDRLGVWLKQVKEYIFG